ncbi:TonB-dependent receptor [Colwellia sp. 4_MG-2023]|uniref:TonB-dependent receptor plug domain-containing protein n=1 Tax=unclassified Colwellia TaxID=196834 RepID=UPI001C08AA38|nr:MULTISPECIES: TonB-dependent receptor [unclassified Colwellia]MBU2925040.1 TonB-dependent receptor [Colwellia sp. C2M11]MDO6506323.1 TonB-dependent receptor [Colwellia sp. 5_MG-2023]MDO6555147.1 TonB-dependent receptor [Colwellia sp. 4_MG-2023]MDO6651667.1 TonB-dependent receptor [Colwellia sp. 3_MG-2023]MDO6664935.1 TonB-dependent receptor [Colwellia sp. 2_MG-2023]
MSTKFRATTLALAVGVALGTAPSYAAEEAESVKEEKVERIAVVGSRGAPRSVNDSPVPIDIIGGDELAKGGNTDMLELLKGSVPSLNVHSNPISDAASLVKPANLRGLSSDSTLILVNGKRRHRASVIALLGGGINDGAQGPDISVIPSSALKQVEVLRDGAAAQYGSDAIAGVMNFVLKDDSDGGNLTVRAGSYYEGDGDTLEVSGNIGMELTKDGFINASFQYKNSDATSRSVQRTDAAAFDAVGVEGIEDPAQIWGSPKIEDDYTIFINSGLDLGDNKEAYMFGNFSERDVRGGFYYRNPHTRGGVYSNGDTDEDGNPNLLIADLDGIGVGGSCSPVNITTDNVLTQDDYINNVVNDDNCFSFNEMLPGGFTPNFGGNIVDTSLTMGTRGELDNGVMYDVSGSVGMNESSYVIYDTLNASLGPETGRDFSPGKHRQLEKTFNLDFNKELELDSINYLMVAAGYEWHAESFEVTAGDVDSYIAGPYTDQGFGIGSNGFPGFKPESAGVFSRQNYAFYVDVEAEITEDLLLGAALRYEDYSSFGDDTNYKITAQYNVTEDFSLRGSISTGFRAPTVGQANYSNVQTSLDGGVLSDSALLPATNPVAQQLGATELTPEESESYTLGAVWNIGEVFITLDYYNIQVEDRISQSDKYSLTEDDKAALKLAGVANVDSIQQVSFFTNDFDTTTQGIDLIANYSTALFEGDSVFSFAYNYNETEVDSYSEVTGDFKVSRLENDLPNHRATLTWSQSYDDFSFFVRGNYYGEYQGVHVDYDATIGDGDAALLFDAEASYFINDAFTVSVGAQNIFDEQATKINRQDGGDDRAWGGVYYETSPFGFNGGYYYVKATYNF